MQAGEMLELLAEGERKNVARSGHVAKAVLDHPSLLSDLVAALWSSDRAVVSHAAHALHTISKNSVGFLNRQRSELLAAFELEQWELLEQLAKFLPGLQLTRQERGQLWQRLDHVLRHSNSSIARTCALQAIVDMGLRYPEYRHQTGEALTLALLEGTKAMQARARKLISTLRGDNSQS